MGKKISELDRAVSLNNGDLFVLSQVDAQAETGFKSVSTPVSDAAQKLLKGLEFPTDLQTDSKTPIGAINELNRFRNDVSEKELIEPVNILDISKASAGYYWRGVLTPSADYNNTGFIPVEPGKTLTFQYGTQYVGPNRVIASMRFIDAYDEDKNNIPSASALAQTEYTVPAGVHYVILGVARPFLKLDNSNFESVVYNREVIEYSPYFEPYYKSVIKPEALPLDLHVYLPKEIPVGIGRTIELYNELVCLEAKKFHLRYSCSIGVQYERKFSITGTTAGDYLLNLYIYDDDMRLLLSRQSVVRVVADSLVSEKKIIPVGDSLTNLKPWLSEVQSLSNAAIKFIGTRGRSDSTIRHEGRSGMSAAGYNENFEYTFDPNYQGNPQISGEVNPFWNGTRFSLAHYNTNQSATVGTADAMLLFLGTNDVFGGYTAEESAQHIKTLVDNIRLDNASIPIFICNTIYRSNQNGYYSNGGQGFTAASGWAFDSDLKIMNFQNALENALNGYSNLYFVPLSVCMDREYDFGQVPVAVNPRLPDVTVNIPSESVHPQNAGYMQIADVMYSSFILHLSA